MQKKSGAGWMDEWVGGWMDGRAGLMIAYSNQKTLVEYKNNLHTV